MTKHLPTLITTIAIAATAITPAASVAATAGKTVTVHDQHAYVDNKAPGRVFSGTLLTGDKFKIDRVHTVKSGPAKGKWYHGTAHITGDHAKNSKGVERPFDLTGWVKADAFS